MIAGIGIDVVDVAEIARRLERDSFLNVFSAGELAHADSLPWQRAEILAGRWAVKEAFAKALGTGLRAEWELSEIDTANVQGRPEIRLSPRMAELLPAGARMHCSISHTRATAAAVVIIETESAPPPSAIA